MKKFALSRRAALRGMLGGAAFTVGLPTLEAMLDESGSAYADGTPRAVRLVTWFFGNGVVKNRWVPGGLQTPILGAAYPLSPMLAPLSEVREYVSVLTGFKNYCGDIITHHEGMTVFNGYTFDQTCQPGQECFGFFSNAGGPTIDQVAAEIIGHLTAVPSVQVGISKRQSGADFGTTMHNLSHKGPLEPLPPLTNPQDVYYKLFGSLSAGDDPTKPSRLAALDAVKGQIASLKKRLGARDIARLDAHLEGISELEAKINAIAPTCDFPREPTETNEDDVNGNEPIESVNRVMSDLLAYAFSCDITRIASVLFHEGASDTYYPGISGGAGHHNNSHGFYTSWDGVNYSEQDAGGLQQLHDGVVFTISQLAYFLERLKDTPDGVDGKNLLDNTTLLLSSDCAEGWSHDVQQDQPVLVVGGGGGKLKTPGVHLRHIDRNICDVSLTALQTVVPEVTSIGAGAPGSSSPVTELLAG